ncbi:MAG: TetR/AcrR family transcriptional regulator [Kiloniellaceae bacterium]
MRPTKRDELVGKALRVFYAHGFHATGMDRLVEETGISKTSMYKHFRRKEDLILAALERRDADFRGWLFARMAALGGTPRGQLLALFDALGEWFAEPGFKGCMFVKAASEFQDAKDPIHAQAAAHKALLFGHLKALAAEAGAGAPEGLARQLLILKEGAIVTAQVEGRLQAATEAKAAAAVLLDAALAKPASRGHPPA